MTRERAVIVAELEAATATAAIAVYRLPAWPADVYGVRAAERLPTEARKFEVFGAKGSQQREARSREMPSAATGPVGGSTPLQRGQGSLF